MITVVSGLPRSGTSMMMQMLQAGGMPVLIDEKRVADDDNPRGYFEDERVKRLQRDSRWVADAEGKVIKVVSQLLFHLPADRAYRIVFLQRDLAEVLKSQQAMLDRRGQKGADVPPAKLEEAFREHLAKVEAWLKAQSNMPVLFLPYAEVISDPLACAQRVSAFLGRDLDTRSMAGVVDPNLYRKRAAG